MIISLNHYLNNDLVYFELLNEDGSYNPNFIGYNAKFYSIEVTTNQNGKAELNISYCYGICTDTKNAFITYYRNTNNKIEVIIKDINNNPYVGRFLLHIIGL